MPLLMHETTGVSLRWRAARFYRKRGMDEELRYEVVHLDSPSIRDADTSHFTGDRL